MLKNPLKKDYAKDPYEPKVLSKWQMECRKVKYYGLKKYLIKKIPQKKVVVIEEPPKNYLLGKHAQKIRPGDTAVDTECEHNLYRNDARRAGKYDFVTRIFPKCHNIEVDGRLHLASEFDKKLKDVPYSCDCHNPVVNSRLVLPSTKCRECGGMVEIFKLPEGQKHGFSLVQYLRTRTAANV